MAGLTRFLKKAVPEQSLWLCLVEVQSVEWKAASQSEVVMKNGDKHTLAESCDVVAARVNGS